MRAIPASGLSSLDIREPIRAGTVEHLAELRPVGLGPVRNFAEHAGCAILSPYSVS